MLENAGRRLGRLLVQGLDDVGGTLIREPGRERGRARVASSEAARTVVSMAYLCSRPAICGGRGEPIGSDQATTSRGRQKRSTVPVAGHENEGS